MVLCLRGGDQDVAHVTQRDELGDQDDQRDAGLDDFDRRIAGGGVVPPDGCGRDIRVFFEAVGDRVVDGDHLVDALAAAARRDAGGDGRAELPHQAGVARTLAAQPDDNGLYLLGSLDRPHEIGAGMPDQVAEHSFVGGYPLHHLVPPWLALSSKPRDTPARITSAMIF